MTQLATLPLVFQGVREALDNALLNGDSHDYDRQNLDVVEEILDWSGLEGYDGKDIDCVRIACLAVTIWRHDNPRPVGLENWTIEELEANVFARTQSLFSANVSYLIWAKKVSEELNLDLLDQKELKEAYIRGMEPMNDMEAKIEAILSK